MSAPLPARPDLSFEKKQAKSLLKTYHAGDDAAAARMHAHLPRLKNDVPAAATLADAQLVIARERGFESWVKLKAHIESRRPLAEMVPPFLQAASNGKLNLARRILAQHPGLTAHSFNVACAAADAEAVLAQLAQDPSAAVTPGPREALPLICACASRMHSAGPAAAAASVRCVQLLLDHGADPNSSFTWGDGVDLSALYYACIGNNAGVVKLLLERGANANDGESVHHSAEMNHRECLELLLAHGADLSQSDPRWKKTILYFLAQIGARPEGVEWLLEHGADPNIPSGDLAERPLHQAAARGNFALTDLLVRHGADPNLPRADGRTSYGLAVRSGNRQVMEALVAAGARTDAVSRTDELIGACMRGDEPAARIILKAYPQLPEQFTLEDKRMLLTAVWQGDPEPIRLMAAMGFDLGVADSSGSTPLHVAAWRGQVEVARLLIQLGAPIHVVESQYGSTPLGHAIHGSKNCRIADEDYCAIIDALVDAGATPDLPLYQWEQPPDVSRTVRAHLLKRGFATAALRQ